jgi:hypothetical protein
MKAITKKCKIHSVHYKNTSYYGNPCYNVYFEDSEGNMYYGRTATNALCAYKISSYRYYGAECELVYHYTRKGNLIIDFYNTKK